MEAKLVESLPEEEGWQYEPKWDGFRALAFRHGDEITLTSKSGKPLARYFPEIVSLLAALDEGHFLLDGELVIPIGDHLSFDALQARLHPAASRINRLSKETPAQLILFDCLTIGKRELIDRPLTERRAALEGFHARHARPDLILSPASRAIADAHKWLARSGGALDGVIAKRLDEPYRPGERAMLKVKQRRAADCVVGGFRESDGKIASLLLGLYDADGKLDHVGFTSAFSAEQREGLADVVRPHAGGRGFTGSAPGGPSRWNGGEAKPWTPLAPKLVAEVIYDQITAGRFRHGTRFLRWRPDKPPETCDRRQLIIELRPSELDALIGI
jgi:ATP-dependent DNA ligase